MLDVNHILRGKNRMGFLKGVAKYTTKMVLGTVCVVLDSSLKTNINEGVQKGLNELFDGTSESASEEFKQAGTQIKEKNEEYNRWINYYNNMPFDKLKSVNPQDLFGVKRAAFIKVYNDRK